MVLLSKDEFANIFYGARPAIEHVFGVFRIWVEAWMTNERARRTARGRR